MRFFKLRPEDTDMMLIDRERFELATRKMPPWYQPSSSGNELSQFAVCPACDNPIQVIGLYRLPKGLAHPYGKHANRSVPGLAMLDVERRDACPYFMPRKPDRHARRRESDPFARKILRTVIEQFDRIAYVLEKDTGVRLSKKKLQEMLASYRRMQGHRYVGANLLNVPWIFAYMTKAVSLYGQKIVDNPELVEAIERELPHAALDHQARITNRDSSYVDINASFISHDCRAASDGQVVEEMIFCVVTTRYRKPMEIYRKSIRFDVERFHRLIKHSDHAQRRRDLVELARRELGDLLGNSS